MPSQFILYIRDVIFAVESVNVGASIAVTANVYTHVLELNQKFETASEIPH